MQKKKANEYNLCFEILGGDESVTEIIGINSQNGNLVVKDSHLLDRETHSVIQFQVHIL